MDITALDFQQARIKHILFKSRLRSVLYGVREPDAALFSRAENPLGQWLDTVVKPKYSAQVEVRQVELLLQRLLESSRSLVTQYQRGQIEEARRGLDQIDGYSEQILALLQQLERDASHTAQ